MDENLEIAKKMAINEKMSWRSFWNGTQGLDGPICRAWNISSYPPIYVLDSEGVIRFKNTGRSKLDASIDKLLELQAATK